MKNQYFSTFFLCAGIIIAVTLYHGDTRPLSADDFSQYTMGYNPEPEEVDRLVEVVPAVSARTILPSSVNLKSYIPPIGTQGRQGSCVGWASTYYAMSIIEKRRRNWHFSTGSSDSTRCSSGASTVFSPAWTYNQINGGRDKGSNRYNALRLLQTQGAAPCSAMPYNVSDYRSQPNSYQKSTAAQYKIDSFKQIAVIDISGMKQALHQGHPIISGFKVSPEMKKLSADNNYVWDSMSSTSGGHAMCVVGYDDSRVSQLGHRGAFLVVNSWGSRFADNGYLWVSYKLFPRACNSSYVAYGQAGGGTTDPVRPVVTASVSAPSWVKATGGTYSDRIAVSWAGVNDAVTYEVMRKENTQNNFTRLGYMNGTAYTDRYVRQGMSYTYKIITIASNGRSTLDDSPSAEGFITAAAVSDKPGQVQGFRGSAVVSGYSATVNLSWSETPGASTYNVYRYDYSSRAWVSAGSTSYASYNDSSVRPGSTYAYTVRAGSKDGYGPWAQTISVKIDEASAGTAPGRVQSVTASQGEYSGKIKITWNPVNSAESYSVWRYNPSIRKWDRNFKSTDTGIEDDSSEAASRQVFYYAVKAHNSYGVSAQYSPYASGYAGYSYRGIGSAVHAPKNVQSQLNSKDKTAVITWNAVRHAASYSIYAKPYAGGAVKKIASVQKNTYTGTLPSGGDLFMYTVRAVNKYGSESGDSQPCAVFHNTEPLTARTVFKPGQGLKNFTGSWTGQHWKGGADSVVMKLSVSSRGDVFTAVLQYGNSRPDKFSGKYAAMSRYIKARGLQFELLQNFDNDVAKVTLDSSTAAGKDLTVYFSRDGK